MPKSLFSSKFIGILLVTYLVTAGVSFAVTPNSTGELLSPQASNFNQLDSTGKSGGFGQFANETKSEICPINGKSYSKSERNLWETRRPILAMIENHVDARPQSGLSLADIVYEAVAEGGITRFMGVFYCGAQADTARVAPVRSARIYFVNIAAEYNTPVYMHVGGGNCSRDEGTGQCTTDKRAMAIEELAKIGWRKPRGNDFDTTSDIGFPVLSRDFNRLGTNKTVATEHTMVGSLPAAWKEAEKRGYTQAMTDGSTWLSSFKPWKISDKSDLVGSIPATDVKFFFWANYDDFAVEWKYDATANTYLRNQAGAPHIDLDTQSQLAATNVIVQFAKETATPDIHKHMLYDVIGEGKGYLFQAGKSIEIKWKKAKQLGRTIFTDKSGKEITLLPGVTWVEILPSTSPVTIL